MAYELEFHRSEDGAEPALDYIRAQTKEHRAKIGRALKYLEELGHQARRPLVDYLGDGIYELRVAIAGHRHRLLYFIQGRALIVVTVGFLKKTERVPPEELTRAARYRADWIRRFGGPA